MRVGVRVVLGRLLVHQAARGLEQRPARVARAGDVPPVGEVLRPQPAHVRAHVGRPLLLGLEQLVPPAHLVRVRARARVRVREGLGRVRVRDG